jgi:hypothetical protein
MSTVPGRESWRDAGLTTPELADAVMVEPDLVAGAVPADPDDPEEHEPSGAGPEPRADADEADLADQLAEVPVDEQDDYR